MNPRTRNNLYTALECDALAAAKYRRFAARARRDDEWELARAFEEAAEGDQVEDFVEYCDLDGLVNSCADNLRNTIEAELNAKVLYEAFAHDAMEDGDFRLSGIYEAISLDKARRCLRLQSLLEGMGVHSSVRTVHPSAVQPST